MCGIFGRFARDGDIGSIDRLTDATNLLVHRGPDAGTWWADGSFFLGHRRLSIIDLANGSQPMATTDGRYVIIFNGEIYNYVEVREELRAQGAVFNTDSDTEVILNGYQVWGEHLPEHLVGMFAFAIVDRLAHTLYLARDRFGEKPLFVNETRATVTFASELSPLTALPDIERQIDRTALAEYLCLNYVPGTHTLLEGIERLPAASWRLYSPTRVRQETYWTLPPTEQNGHPQAFQTTLNELQTRIDDSVHIALRSDVPVALFLSGGIDSAIIADSAVRQGKLQHAYCLDFAESGFSEYPNASRVAQKLGIELRRVVLSADALQNFLATVEHADDPLADSSALPVWTLAKAVSRDYKVVITGDGGDELFGGYLTYKATACHDRIITALPMFVRHGLTRLATTLPVSSRKVAPSYKLMRFLRGADLTSSEAHFTWNGTWLPSQVALFLKGYEGGVAAERVLALMAARHHLSVPLTLSQLQRCDLADYLPNDILTKVDRMTMAHGLESRAPFLVPKVAEFAVGLPDAWKMSIFGQSKRILRALATRIYGPQIGYAKKQGFSIPVHHWLRGPMREVVEELVTRQHLEDFGLIDTDAVLQAKAQHMQGRAQLGFELWGLMVLIAWYRVRVQQPVRLKQVGSLRRVTLGRLA
jgi:asparagine synthase (glutamine-hydrolysing)